MPDARSQMEMSVGPSLASAAERLCVRPACSGVGSIGLLARGDSMERE